MKSMLYTFVFAVAGFLLSIGLFYVAGAVWGPLYQSENEAARNFKIFLSVSVVFILAGGFIGHKLGRRPL